MPGVVREETEIKIEIAQRPAPEDVGHVNRVLPNVEGDPVENAGKDRAAAMGQRERPATDQEDEGPVGAVQQLIYITYWH